MARVIQTVTVDASSVANLSVTLPNAVVPGNAIYCVASVILGAGLNDIFTFVDNQGDTFTNIIEQLGLITTPLAVSIAFNAVGGSTTVDMTMTNPGQGGNYVTNMIVMEIEGIYAVDSVILDENIWQAPNTLTNLGTVLVTRPNAFIVTAVQQVGSPGPAILTAGTDFTINRQIATPWRTGGSFSTLGVESQNVIALGSYVPTIISTQQNTGGAAGINATASFSALAPPLLLKCPDPNAQKGIPYDSFLIASGGTPPYEYSIVAGVLPDGLTLDPDTGEISGTPTVGGFFPYTAQVVDSGSPQLVTTVSCGIVVPCFLVEFPFTGPYNSPEGFPISNGHLLVRLAFDCNCFCDDYQVTGNNHSKLFLDEDGFIIGTPMVRPNDQLNPLGSYYIIQVFSEAGQLIFGPYRHFISSTD